MRIFAAKIFDISVIVLGLLLNVYLHIVTYSVELLLYIRGENGTLERRKTKNDAVALYEPPEGSLNGPVAVQGTVHCVADRRYCRVCCGCCLNVNGLRLCLHHVV